MLSNLAQVLEAALLRLAPHPSDPSWTITNREDACQHSKLVLCRARGHGQVCSGIADDVANDRSDAY